MQREKIVVVEDEAVVALDLQCALEDMGHSVCAVCSSVAGALEAVERHSPTLVLMDIQLQGAGDGIDACNRIYQRWQLPVIFLSAFADKATLRRAAGSKPFGYMMKPFLNKELEAVIRVARARHDVERLVARSEQRLALVVEAAELGVWEWDARADQLRGDARFDELWGATICPSFAGLSAMLRRIHPSDRAQVTASIKPLGYFQCSFRGRRESGEYVWMELFGNRRQTETGETLVGALRELSEAAPAQP